MSGKDFPRLARIYFLSSTFVIGTYIILFSGTNLLPIDQDAAGTSAAIIVPVLMGQLAVIFRAFTAAGIQERFIPVPRWAVKGPPLALVALMAVTVLWCHD